MADGDEEGGGVRTECTKTRRQGRAWCAVENTREPLLSDGRVYIKLGGVFNPGRFCSQGTLGDVWGHLSLSRLGDAVGSICRMLLNTLQGTRQPTTRNMYPKSIVPR